VPRIDYNAWAADYDATRSASASVASVILAALGPPQARLLLDIGGGTGNFAALARETGFRVTVIDVAPAMLRRAVAKLGSAVRLTVGEAQHPPYKDASFDCAMCINVLRHIPNRAAALAEARRVVRDGPLVIRTTTKETEKSHWAHAYFPTLTRDESTTSWQPIVPWSLSTATE
jgi:ubiquinone/menaquinone biosynthesis C-methylase UbiE